MSQDSKHPARRGKVRVDVLLVERGLVSTRAKAQALVLAGRVYNADQRVDKPGHALREDAPLVLREGDRFVSRGGHKLEGALQALSVEVAGCRCVDVGASTGGFTDCLLQYGAERVYAVDVGEAQLADKLRTDQRVVVLDRTNARYLERSSFADALDLAVVDASFIGIEKLLPALARILPPAARLLCLVKPQFEVGQQEAARSKGVIRDPELRRQVIDQAHAQVAAAGFEILGGCDSALKGPKGNLEYFIYARRLEAS